MVGNQSIVAFDQHFTELIEQYKHNPSIRQLWLKRKIPEEYNYENFLSTYFSDIPLNLTADDFQVFQAGRQKVVSMKEERRPRTFISILRFLEYYRRNVDLLFRNLKIISEKYFSLKDINEPRDIIKKMITSKDWTQEDYNNKSQIFSRIHIKDPKIEVILKKLAGTIISSDTVSAQWWDLIKRFYLQSIRYINGNVIEDEDSETSAGNPCFNLKKVYAPKDLEKILPEYYLQAMDRSYELLQILNETRILLG